MFINLFRKKSEFKEVFKPKGYVLFNVDTFNAWFNDKDNNAVYANPGIFLRLDKLSISHIQDYLIKCHGLNLTDYDFDEEIRNFYDEIRADWFNKINYGIK
jgi:hypothetical protein